MRLFPIPVGLLVLMSAPASAQQDKLAQTGMKFLSVSVDPRAAGLGDALAAVQHGAVSMFYNPAGMAWQQDALNVMVGRTQWIAEIDYSLGSLAFRPAGGRFGVLGLTYLMVDYGELEETIRADNEQGYLDVGTFSPSAWSLGIGYARTLSDRFSIGAHVKWANQYLADPVIGFGETAEYVREEASVRVTAYDFGMLYKTGFRSLNFAVSARNFSREIAFAEESIQLPLTLHIGAAMDLMDLTRFGPSAHQLLLSVEAANPRDYSEQVKTGVEYVFLDAFALRMGYAFPTDEQGISFGLGVRQFGLGADYAYTDFGVFTSVHRLAINVTL